MTVSAASTRSSSSPDLFTRRCKVSAAPATKGRGSNVRGINSKAEGDSSRGGRLETAMLNALKNHWPEYLSEAAGLGAFMVSACAFAALLFHPSSPVVRGLESEAVRRVLRGVAMGLTNVLLVYSPWGMRSGAHNNPAVTLSFYRLGKVKGAD